MSERKMMLGKINKGRESSFLWSLLSVIFVFACSSKDKPFELEKPRTPVAGQWVPGEACSTESEGQMRVGYTTQSMVGEAECATGIQHCSMGQWQGPILYEDCHANTKSCDGMAHGTIQTGYAQQTTTPGVPCPPATRTCQNGQWIGPAVFPTCLETH